MEKLLVFLQVNKDLYFKMWPDHFIYKSWSVNSDWLTLFICSKVTRGDYVAFKMLLTILRLQEQSFQRVHCWFKKKWWNLQLFLWIKKILPSQLTLLTENSLANCHFSKKDILQKTRNSDSNKAHDIIWAVFVC